jgi:hypothetical protein
MKCKSSTFGRTDSHPASGLAGHTKEARDGAYVKGVVTDPPNARSNRRQLRVFTRTRRPREPAYRYTCGRSIVYRCDASARRPIV